MKPLLIQPPAPARWPAVENLLAHEHPLRLEDLAKRFTVGTEAAQDAFAVIPEGGHYLAAACINKRYSVGILAHVFTRPEHRRRGHARKLINALLAWFDMTGGKRLYLTASADLADGLFGKLGFRSLRRSSRESGESVTMLRSTGSTESVATGDIAIRDVSREDWPLMVALLQHQPGPDPRLSLDESAVGAEITALQLISRQEKGVCQLKAAVRGEQIVGLVTVATDQLGDRTYAMIMPHGDPAAELRAAITDFARSKGYQHIDFPMETLADTEGAPSSQANNT